MNRSMMLWFNQKSERTKLHFDSINARTSSFYVPKYENWFAFRFFDVDNAKRFGSTGLFIHLMVLTFVGIISTEKWQSARMRKMTSRSRLTSLVLTESLTLLIYHPLNLFLFRERRLKMKETMQSFDSFAHFHFYHFIHCQWHGYCIDNDEFMMISISVFRMCFLNRIDQNKFWKFLSSDLLCCRPKTIFIWFETSKWR